MLLAFGFFHARNDHSDNHDETGPASANRESQGSKLRGHRRDPNADPKQVLPLAKVALEARALGDLLHEQQRAAGSPLG